MAEDAKSVTKLPVRTVLVSSDQLVCVSNVAGVNGGNVTLISVGNFSNSLIATQQPDPANSVSLVVQQGTLFFSNSFGYIAIANNVTRRFAISVF